MVVLHTGEPFLVLNRIGDADLRSIVLRILVLVYGTEWEHIGTYLVANRLADRTS